MVFRQGVSVAKNWVVSCLFSEKFLAGPSSFLDRSAVTKFKVFGIDFSSLSLEMLVDELAKNSPDEKEGITLFTANLDHVVKMRKSPAFRQAYGRASIVTADGFPVYFFARLRGAQLPGRVTGADLFPALLARLSPKKHLPFFVVGDKETAACIEGVLVERGFKKVVAIVPPFGFEEDADYSHRLAERVAAHGTTHLFFCVGAPKSEIWLDQHRQMIGPCHALALGMGANFFAGTVRRAPPWVQRIGGEWFWRFLHEPRRLFRRYFIDSWWFLLAMAEDLMRKKIS